VARAWPRAYRSRRTTLKGMDVTGDRIRVVLIEDHGIVREGLKLILQQAPDIAVLGEAGDGAGGLRLLQRLAAEGGVDVLVTDLGLPDLGGLEVARRAKALLPGLRVLLVTMYTGEEHIRGMLDAGADGYLLKQAAAQELPAAIRVVARGETALSPAVARRLLTQGRRGRERHGDPLTERERQVLAELAAGRTSKEIARRLGLAAKTVDNHRARLLRKLGVATTGAAIAKAYREGLLAPPRAG
jgi:DNA-binding NarL/FixJ family response regulator